MSGAVLFVNHRLRRCGVHEFGLEIAAQLAPSQKFRFVYIECESLDELVENVEEQAPTAIIFNYHPTPMPWGPVAALAFSTIPTICIVHDVTSEMADSWIDPFFFRFITHDPDLRTNNPLFSCAPRPLPQYRSSAAPPDNGPIRIGSFGFAAHDKGFDQVVLAAQASFDHCLIRLHIPGNDFGDVRGDNARLLAEHCRSMLHKPGAALEVSHDFLSRDELIEFLASNHLNALFYEPDRGAGGISSASDLALACRRPMALRRGKMFRNFANATPSIFIDELSLQEILANGTAPLQQFLSSWSPEALIAAYESVVTRAIDEFDASRSHYRRAATMAKALLDECQSRERSLEAGLAAMHEATTSLQRQIAEKTAHIAALTSNMARYASDLRIASSRARLAEDAVQNRRRLGRIRLRLRHRRLKVPRFNTLLDHVARQYYAPAIQTLWQAAPATMQRKIPEANVQQGFMLAAVERLFRKAGSGRLLCVGCFEDTACLALQALGYDVDAIDPDLNFDLAGFKANHPDKIGSYSVVFSTSVIEHVSDDEQFVRDLLEMTAPKGFVLLTCDFRDDWTPDQQKPSSDFRIYTSRDMDRLLGAMGAAKLIDEPDWLAHKPDFAISEFGTTMHYGFASLAVRKLKAPPPS